MRVLLTPRRRSAVAWGKLFLFTLNYHILACSNLQFLHSDDVTSSLDSSDSEGPHFPGIPESTKEYIRQLLCEKDEARQNYSQETIRSQCLAAELEVAQSDWAVVRAQLAVADSRVACKSPSSCNAFLSP